MKVEKGMTVSELIQALSTVRDDLKDADVLIYDGEMGTYWPIAVLGAEEVKPLKGTEAWLTTSSTSNSKTAMCIS